MIKGEGRPPGRTPDCRMDTSVSRGILSSASAGQRTCPLRNRPRDAALDCGESVIDLDDSAVRPVQIARANSAVDTHGITGAQLGQRGRRPNGVQEMPPGVHRIRKCSQMIIELARGDRVQQRPFGIPVEPLEELPSKAPRLRAEAGTSASANTH